MSEIIRGKGVRIYPKVKKKCNEKWGNVKITKETMYLNGRRKKIKRRKRKKDEDEE